MRTYAPAPTFAFALALGLALLGLDGGAPVLAKGKGKPAPPVMDAKQAKVVVAKLKSAEADRVLEGLAAAAGAGAAGAPVAPPIEDILERGSTAAITKASLEALGAIGASSSSASIRPYIRHRVPEIRRAAAKALGSTRGPDAIAGCKEGLRSADGQVRGYAAIGLGGMGVTEALPDLFLALDHGVSEAAAAIGQLCSDVDCERLVTKLGKAPFDVMTSAIDPILFRPKALPEEALIKIIGLVRELRTPEAGKYLGDALGRWPEAASKTVKQSLEGAAGRGG